MKTTAYLTVNADGRINMTKRPPYAAQRSGEVVVMVNIDIPDSVFNIPVTVVNLEVPEPAREDVIIEVDYYDPPLQPTAPTVEPYEDD